MQNIQEVREKRRRLGIAQWPLAARVGRSGTWLSLRECGYVSTSVEELEALSEALQQVGCQAGGIR